jgi:hypothetical protein
MLQISKIKPIPKGGDKKRYSKPRANTDIVSILENTGKDNV